MAKPAADPRGRRQDSGRQVAAPKPGPPVASRSPRAIASWQVTRRVGGVCITCRGLTVIDSGVDPETGRDLIVECAQC